MTDLLTNIYRRDDLIISRAIPYASTGFIRIAMMTPTRVGDDIYFFGGERSGLTADGRFNINSASQCNNDTIALSLTSSWSTVNITMRSIPNGIAPPRNRPAVWPDPQNDSFYVFGGDLPMVAYGSRLKPLSSSTIYRYDIRASSWSQVVPSGVDSASFTQIQNRAYGTTVNTQNTGLWLGGYSSGTTDGRGDSAERPQKGLISYNMTTNTWKALSMKYYTPSETQLGGKAEYLAEYGLVVIMGGSAPPGELTRAQGWQDVNYLDFRNVTLYNPETQSWYWQSTTGDYPTPRILFCSSVVPTGNGSYEIFVFGGYYGLTITAYDEVYILTIPGFVWYKGPSTGDGRHYHGCQHVGGGQVLSMGGVNVTRAGISWSQVDPWSYGLQVFNMKSMSWTTEYNAKPPVYQGMQAARDWYAAGNTADWSSPTVKALFSRSQASVPSASSSPTGSISNPNPTESKSKPVIIGGIVAGLLGLALIGLVAFLVIRHRRRRKHRNIDNSRRRPKVMDLLAGEPLVEMEGDHERPMMDSTARLELDFQNQIHELPRMNRVHELPAQNRPSELPA